MNLKEYSPIVLNNGIKIEVFPYYYTNSPDHDMILIVLLDEDEQNVQYNKSFNDTSFTEFKKFCESLIIEVSICKCCGKRKMKCESFRTGPYDKTEICEKCRKDGINKEINDLYKDIEKYKLKEDKKQKKLGMTYRISVWYHPVNGGDDREAHFYTNYNPLESKTFKKSIAKKGYIAEISKIVTEL
jgi:hypothetical protein